MKTITKLATLTQAQLNTWAVRVQTQAQSGKLPNYIPRLAQADPAAFAVQVETTDGQLHAYGNLAQPFPLMSVIKPFVLLYLLEQLGTEAVFQRVGMIPSDQPFSSLRQLEADQGWPRNPMINSGAIVLASLLPGQVASSRAADLCQWLNQRVNSHLFLDEQMLAAVHLAGGQDNQAIAGLLAQSGYLQAKEVALDTYNHVCCLAGTVADLASLGMLLAQRQGPIASINRRTVNALMLTCGLYQAAGKFAIQIGLPTKSGVSGALLAVVPGQGAIACYSPPLDPAGNSLAGLYLLEQMTQALDLSIFS